MTTAPPWEQYLPGYGQIIAGVYHPILIPNPNYDPNYKQKQAAAASQAPQPTRTANRQQPSSQAATPAPSPPHLNFTYDTIGQTVPRTIGHCRLRLYLIWVQGQGIADPNQLQMTTTDTPSGSRTIDFGSLPAWVAVGVGVLGASVPGVIDSGTTVSSLTGSTITISSPTLADMPSGSVVYFVDPTLAATSGGVIGSGTDASTGTGTTASAVLTFAAALCEPIDPNELGNIAAIFDGSTVVYDIAVPGGTSSSGTAGAGSLKTTADCPNGTRVFTFASVPGWIVPGINVNGASVAGMQFGTTVSSVTSTTVTVSLPVVFDIPSGSFVDFASSAITITGTGNVAVISPSDQSQMASALQTAIVYPGTENQNPDALIVADRGVDATNAFRGLRYIIFQDFPLAQGTASLAALSVAWQRLNPLPRVPNPKTYTAAAVEFAAGAG